MRQGHSSLPLPPRMCLLLTYPLVLRATGKFLTRLIHLILMQGVFSLVAVLLPCLTTRRPVPSAIMPLTDENTSKEGSLFAGRTLPPLGAHPASFPRDCPLLNPVEWLTPSRCHDESRCRGHGPQDDSSPIRPTFSSPTHSGFTPPTSPVFSSPTRPAFSSPIRPVFLPPIRPIFLPPIRPLFSPPIASSTCDDDHMIM